MVGNSPLSQLTCEQIIKKLEICVLTCMLLPVLCYYFHCDCGENVSQTSLVRALATAMGLRTRYFTSTEDDSSFVSIAGAAVAGLITLLSAIKPVSASFVVSCDKQDVEELEAV